MTVDQSSDRLLHGMKRAKGAKRSHGGWLSGFKHPDQPSFCYLTGAQSP
jgi:hypothetical protein